MSEKKVDCKSIKDYKRYRNEHIALKSATYVAPVIPFGVELGVNWQTWFGGNNAGDWHIPLGLATAVVSTISAVLAISKKDSETMKKIGPFISVGIAFLMFGATCIFLSNVLMQLGYLLVYSALGIFGSAVADAVDKKVVKEKYDYSKSLLDEYGLSKRGKWKYDAKEQAKKDAKEKGLVIPVE